MNAIQDKYNLTDRMSVVVGAGESGRAAALLLRELGAGVRLLDRKRESVPRDFLALAKAKGIEFGFGEHTPAQFADANLVVLSPGVNPSLIRPHLPDPATELLAEMELAARCTDEPILALTGTNGKTTTVSLAAHMLRHAGKTVFLGGNIGTPLSSHVLAGEKADVLVLEVSSFQLMTCGDFHPNVGVLLNFSPNHLDWHADLDEYLDAKLKLFANQEPGDLAVLPLGMKDELDARVGGKAERLWFAPEDRFWCESLPGGHNQENMEAAFQACAYFGVSEDQAQESLKTFSGLPHRLTRVAVRNGVLFVDDSKATTVESVRAALKSFNQPVRLLAGGVFKGGDLAGLVPLLKERVREVGLFGDSREEFEAAWTGAVDIFWEPDLERAVRRLAKDAEPGEVVLLSPGTASFDLYENYKARGKDFQRIVGELP